MPITGKNKRNIVLELLGGEKVNAPCLISIGRQYGAGGREVGERLAKKLHLPLYDRKLVAFVSAHLEKGIGLDELDFTYEKLYGEESPYTLIAGEVKEDNYLFSSQSRAIRALAERGSGIFIGRCANYILSEGYHFFIVADDDFREERGRTVYHKSLKELKKEDEKRSSYYNYYTSLHWGNPADYHMVINTGRCGIDGAVDIIADYAARRK